MSAGTPVYLAFRVFGNFHWPPLRSDFDVSTTDTGKTLQKGVVEIYYGPRNPGNPLDLVAYLRWTRRSDDLASPIPEPLTDPSLAVDIQRPDAELTNELQKDQALFRLTGTAPTSGHERRLLFRGAFLFDQFTLGAKDTTAGPPLDLRWALARTFQHYAKDGTFGSNFFSEVVIGQPSDTLASGSRICFNFGLPTPGPQSGDDDNRCYALPFAAIFQPTLKLPSPADAAAPPVEKFMAGAGPSAALQDGPPVPVTTNVVKHTQLGHFGFCAGVYAGGDQFLYFPRHAPGGDYRFKSFWPTSTRAFVEDFLGMLSQSAQPGPHPEQLVVLDNSPTNNQGELAHSVRFRTDSGRTIITFRTRVTISGHFNAPGLLTDDLRVDWSVFPPRSQSIQLRIPHSDKWLHTQTDTLHIEREIAYEIPDKAIWSFATAPAAGGDITVRLGFSAKQIYGSPLDDTRFIQKLLEQANEAMPLPRLDLRNILDGQPQSILPDVTFAWPTLPNNAGPSDPNTARFVLCGAMPFSFRPPAEAGGAIAFKKKYPNREIWAGLDLDLSLWSEDHLISDERDDGDTPVRLDITMSPVSFSYKANALALSLIADPSVPSGDQSQWCRFRIVPRAKTTEALQARLGGFEFTTLVVSDGVHSDTAESPADYSYWRFADRHGVQVHGDMLPTNVDLRLRLDIATIKPIGTDIAWGDRTGRPAPLLISSNAGGGKFVLDLRETIAQSKDRQLTASIYDTRTGDSDSGDYVVLSEEPFSVIRVRSQPLQDRGTQDNTLVATFDSDTRQWQVKLAAPVYHYEFPPQVAGESMDKPRRLEIADDMYPAPPAAGMPPGHAPVDADGNPFAVEFRLTPSAEIWIRPSDVERGYFLPEWASHEIFRQRGDLGIGAAMTALRGEFLYGLSVGIDPSKETGAGRSARVAEIEALFGQPPRKLGVANLSTALPRRWMALDHAIARRPERIEIWARDLNSSVPFAPAKFSDGVTFALRQTALHRPAVPLTDQELREADLPNTGKPRVSESGLSGGALWPLESKNFFNSLVQNPTSVGGTIEQIALSPIGGDANQKAEFLNGKVRIISETRNGFVQRHKIEIIGRISVFWHWAKYVVVYERTVNPSAQFTPEGRIKTRTRRPVLRKVSEYIYIRQPQGIRRYPDFPTAKASSSGLLKAVKFNSITINVDSAWSEDVEQYGWKIPLWNREAARRRPQVYPRPDIAFSTFAEGQGEEAETSQECIEPDNIYFYADASPNTGADTDSWLSLVGIDCSSLPPPTDAFQRALEPRDQPGDGTNTKPSAPRVPRGLRRFTWRLAPPSKKTVLNAGRSGQPVFAGLESITFMRSNAPEATDSNKTGAADMIAALSSADGILPPANKLGHWPAGDPAPTAFKEVDDFLAAVTSHIPNNVTTAANKLADALQHQILTRPGVKDGIDAAKGYANQLALIAKFIPPEPASRCARMADDLVGSIKRKELLILDAVGTWQAHAEEAIPHARPTSAEQLKKDLVTGLATAISRVFGEVGIDPGQITLGTAKARAILNDFENDVRQAETALELQLNALKGAYNDNKPWSASRIQEFEAKWIANGNRVFDSIKVAVEEGGLRVTTELNDLAQPIANVLHDAMLGIAGTGSKLESDVNSAWALTAAYFDAAIGKLDQFLEVKDDGKDILNRLDDKLAAFQARIQVSNPQQAFAINDVRAALPQIRTDAAAARTALQHLQSNSPQIKIADLVDEAVGLGAATLNGIANAIAQTNAALAEIDDIAVKDAITTLRAALADFTRIVDAGVAIVRDFGVAIDGAVDAGLQRIHAVLQTDVFEEVEKWFARIEEAAKRVEDKLTAVKQAISADIIAKMVADHVLTPAVNSALKEITDATVADYPNTRERIVELIGDVSGYVQFELQKLSNSILGDAQKAITEACGTIAGGLDDARKYLDDMANNVGAEANRIVAKWLPQVTAALNDAVKLAEVAEGFVNDVRHLNNDIASSYASAVGYSNRVLEAAGNIGSGGIGAVPGNILRLYAAAASAPALPNLDFARDRLGYYYNQLNDVIDTTPAEAWFGRIGDELKALGLSIPFSKIGDGILPDDLSNFDISRIFKNFSGMKLDKLFQGYKLPPGARDAIKVTHAFDRAQARAWVEIDVDLPMPERKAMFSVGPFELDYVDSRFVAMVRLEASKSTNTVDQIGRAKLTTNFEAVISGQTMVSFQQVAINYEKSTGLKVDFDPKKIRLNAIFQFIQDTLGSIFPDEVGGMKVIKEYGIPVGIEHEFAMPPIDLNYATSGVSHLVISNRFGLVAFPEFVIYDRFSLSRPELPFIFSIFVIGGTGYITIDAEYHPFRDHGLMVVVEAGAGGSAQIGFAFGPVSGSVFITLSVALAYTKVFGKPGGGLTISLVLVVAGNVDIAGIVTIYIGVLLRLSYQDSGAIDASGTLTVTIHITRFFKIEVNANVQYRLRGGQSKTTSSVSANAGVDTAALGGEAKKQADKLLGARG